MAFDSRLLGGIGVLLAAVEAGSFVRAAESLGLEVHPDLGFMSFSCIVLT